MTGAIVAVHGGAGRWPDERIPSGIDGTRRAAEAGAAALSRGALVAVVEAVKVLEEDPNFNAGRGSTLTRDGTVELDAAVMTGDLGFGAVAACPPVTSAIEAALAVYRDGEHSLMAGEAAAEFARTLGVATVGAEELIVERAVKALEDFRAQAVGGPGGTVGAVAVDDSGTLAAATSTGGIIHKRRGRVGDTPLPGAGTYADDALGVAVSATGHGESILRVLLCREVARRAGLGEGLDEASAGALRLMEDRVGGRAGLVVVDVHGRFHVERNTPAMPWACCRPGEEVVGGA
jgi:beta-aspartyl-peptidase (threonine type)